LNERVLVTPKTRADLGFPQLLQALADRCRTPLGVARALARAFLADDAVPHALATVDEARACLEQEEALPLDGVEDVRALLVRAEKRALLDPRELIQVRHVLSASLEIRARLAIRRVSAPHLYALSGRLPELGSLTERLESAFDPSGDISDHASPTLKAARDRSRGLHRAIKQRLEASLRDERFAQHLREPYFSVRNDRYVVPVLASDRAAVPGIVHNASQSGQTLFVEPEVMIGLGNDLAIAQSLVLEEERFILQELTAAIGQRASEISEGVEALATLDEAFAAARLAQALDAQAPSLEPADGALHLTRMRHPLLVLQNAEVVANELALTRPLRVLVISGPNAGGKTVTLTGVGLCALMVRSGLPIPAGPDSHVPLFASVHGAVGDDQDLHQGLSTFSAHVARLKEIDAEAEPGALVLIDEIAADTDPREGAALAIAVLEDLIERGALVAVTTHLEEVKALAHMDARFQNARVGFDAQRMSPTYRLQLGMAGQSSAIDVATHMGLPQRICARARELTRQAAGPLSQALQAAETERQKAVAAREAAEETRRSTAAERDQARAEREAERHAADAARAQQQDALRQELEAAAEELRLLIADLRARPSLKAAVSARQDVLDRADSAERSAEEARASATPPAAPVAPLIPGGHAQHRKLKQVVEILALEGQEALVAAGVMKMRVPIAELTPLAGQRPASRFPASADRGREVSERAERSRPAAVDEAPATCDVRGMRVDEALRAVERWLDGGLRRGEPGAVILHGHGTGALKDAIRNYLDGSPYVRMFRPGDSHEGGDGVTVVALRA
jgi:DNA mismatch repair protein MutS2